MDFGVAVKAEGSAARRNVEKLCCSRFAPHLGGPRSQEACLHTLCVLV